MVSTLLFFLYLFLPLNFALNPTDTIDLPFVRFFILIISLTWLGLAFFKKRAVIFSLSGASVLFAWFIWSSISFLWAIDPSWTYRKAFFLINFSFLALILFSQEKNTLEKILKFFLLGAIGASMVGILESLSQIFLQPEIILQFWVKTVLPLFLGFNFSQAVGTYPSLLVNILGNTYLRATAFFPDPHIFSFYLGMALPVSFVFWQKKNGIFYKVASILLFLGVLLSFSRGGYVAVILMIAWLCIISIFTKKSPLSFRAIAFIGTCFIIAIFSPVGSRLISSFSSEEGSRIERVELIKKAFSTVGERPFVGVGLGNYPLYVKPEASFREPIYAHNLYLDIAVETGLVGLTLFLLVLGIALSNTFFSWKQSGNGMLLAVHMGLIYFIGHSFFETPIFSVHIFPIFLLLLVYGIRTKVIKT